MRIGIGIGFGASLVVISITVYLNTTNCVCNTTNYKTKTSPLITKALQLSPIRKLSSYSYADIESKNSVSCILNFVLIFSSKFTFTRNEKT